MSVLSLPRALSGLVAASFGSLGVTLALCVGGCSPRPAPPAAATGPQAQNGVSATLTTTPSPPHTGDDTLIVTLTDSQTNAPIGDANVSVTAAMLSPRLPGTLVTGRAQGNGVYQVPVRLGIATKYNIQVLVQRPGHALAAFSFPLEAQQ